MTQVDQRATVKGFGEYIDNNFYSSHPASEFPNHFFGYHAAQDLETFTNEKQDSNNTPVYFVTSGTILYIGSLSGYGGVILLKLDGTQDTALYGHVRITNLKYSVGQHVKVDKPTVLTYLGTGFSAETSGERKHLHFGVYKGQDLYFHGHEANKTVLNSRWYNPIDYLREKNAQAIEQPINKTPAESPNNHKSTIIERLLSFLRNIF